MSKDIHKWSDGRYVLMFDEHTFFVFDNEKDERMIALEVTERLNEQQATINKLNDELELTANTKLYSRRELERKVDEQQATICRLQDLCGESDSENAKLRIENKRLQEENMQLKNKLNKEYIKECSIK